MDKARKSPDAKLFKKLNDNIWEFRTLYMGCQYRFLAFWDFDLNGDSLVIVTHGFIKKTSKVPSSELEKAVSIRKTYLRQKVI
jgi:phage-related protein